MPADHGISGTGCSQADKRIEEIRQLVAAGHLSEDEAGIWIAEIRGRL